MIRAYRLERQRDLDNDPAFGVEQLVNIAWTSISTAKSNPAPGLLIIRSLRDLLARWACDTDGDEITEGEEALPIVYPDALLSEMMDACRRTCSGVQRTSSGASCPPWATMC